MDDVRHDEESHSIVVRSLSPTVDKTDIMMYFQSRKHGGGDIKDVTVLGNGAAIVTFEDKKCVQDVLGKEHVLKGVLVEVNQCPSHQGEDINQVQVFAKVSAKIDPTDINLSIQDTRVLVKNLQKQINVRCVEGSDAKFVVSGSYLQIIKCHGILSELLSSQRNHGNQSNGVLAPVTVVSSWERHGTSPRKNEKLETTELRSERKEELSNGVSSLVDSTQENNIGNYQDTLTAHLKQDSQGNLYEELIKITESKWRIFSKVYRKQLTQLMKDYSVVLELVGTMSKVLIKTSNDCNEDMLKTATKKISDLYNTAANGITCTRFALVDSNHEVKLRQTVAEVNKKDEAALERAPDRQSWEIFGEVDNVEEVLQLLESKFEIKRLGLDSEQANGHTDAADDEESSNVIIDDDTEEALMNVDKDDNDDDESGEDVSSVLEHDLGCVRVSVYRGDITDETSDAIVNAANQSLSHDAGVAKAIVSKGGQSIQDECTRIVANKGKLKTGEATITHSGNLSCKMIIHAVGPIWNRNEREKGKNLLKTACLSSLQQAEKYGFKSIAFPAISSGIYGMPKKVCAKVMFDAVEEYNKCTTSSQEFKLTDVRFVNNDIKTVKVFQREFIARYGKKKSTRKPQMKRLSSQARATSFDQESQYCNRKSCSKKATTRVMWQKEPESEFLGGDQLGDSTEQTSPVLPDNDMSMYMPTWKPSEQHKERLPRGKPQPNKFSKSSNATHLPFNDDSEPITQRSRGVPQSTCNGYGGARPKHNQRNDVKARGVKSENLSSNKRLKEEQKEKCSICLAGIHQPTTLPKCKHTFCKVCLEEALKKNAKCPYCREPVPSSYSTGRQPHGAMVHRVDSFYVPGYDDFGTMIRDLVVPRTTARQSHAAMVHRVDPAFSVSEYDDYGTMNRDTVSRSTGRHGTMVHRVEHFSLPGYEDCSTILIQYSLSGGIQGPKHPNPGQRYDSTCRTAYLPDNRQGRDVMKLLKKAFDRGLVFTVGRSMTSGRDNQIIWGDIPHKTCINGGPSNYGYPDPTYLIDVQQILKAMLN